MSDYATIRDVLHSVLGATIVDLSQQDEEEWERDGQAYICLHFADGMMLKIPVGDQPIELINEPLASRSASE